MTDFNLKKEGGEKNKTNKGLVLFYLYEYFNFLLVILLLIILILGFFFVVRPKYMAILQNSEIVNNERQKKKEEYDKLKGKIDTYKNSFSSVNQLNSKKIEAMLPSRPEKENLFVQLEDLIKKRGLILNEMNMTSDDEQATAASKSTRSGNEEGASVSQASRVGIISITLSVKGLDYIALIGLLDAIETNLRLLNVNGLNYSPANSSVNLELEAYYLR